MGKVLTMKEIEKMAVAKDMPLGVTEAVFEKIDYRPDPEDDENILGCFVHFEGFKGIYLPFSEGQINYQLDYLLEQLGVESYSPKEVNAAAGTIVKVSRYLKTNQKKVTKSEYTEWKAQFEGALPVYIDVTEYKDGSALVKNTFTNTNFNVKTIK